MGLNARERLELLVGGGVQDFGRAPERPFLSLERGVLVGTHDGFDVDGHRVEISHKGLLDTDEGVLVASWPPSLYDRAGRCLHTFSTTPG